MAVLKQDVNVRKQDVAVLKQRTDKQPTELLGERFEGLLREFRGSRGEIVTRIGASEERMKDEVAALRAEIRSGFDSQNAQMRLIRWFMGSA